MNDRYEENGQIWNKNTTVQRHNELGSHVSARELSAFEIYLRTVANLASQPAMHFVAFDGDGRDSTDQYRHAFEKGGQTHGILERVVESWGCAKSGVGREDDGACVLARLSSAIKGRVGNSLEIVWPNLSGNSRLEVSFVSRTKRTQASSTSTAANSASTSSPVSAKRRRLSLSLFL